MSVSEVTRYRWTKTTGRPRRLHLIDGVSAQPIAVIFQDASRRWHWSRKTSLLLHGAPPADGRSATLDEAKRRTLEGLPSA
jgi:hypothetical protein